MRDGEERYHGVSVAQLRYISISETSKEHKFMHYTLPTQAELSGVRSSWEM